MALDKMEYAESLYDQYLVARSKSQTDKDYEAGFLAFITANKEISKTSVDEWNTMTTDFVDEQNRADAPAPAPRSESGENGDAGAAGEEEAGAAAADKKRAKDEMMYRPKQSLSSEDGVAFFQTWTR